MKYGHSVASALLLSVLCNSLTTFRSYSKLSRSNMALRLLHQSPEDHSLQQLTGAASISCKDRLLKGVTLSCLTGLLIFSSFTEPSLAQSLGTKVFIDESVTCESIRLNNLVKEGAGGGGTVFSATVEDIDGTKTVSNKDQQHKVAVKVSWVTSANSVRHECEVLKHLEKYQVQGVERCIASGVYVPPSEKSIPSSATASMPDGFFLADKTFTARPTTTEAFLGDEVAGATNGQKSPRKGTTFLVSLYEEDMEEKQGQRRNEEMNTAKKPQEGDRAMIVLDPFFIASRPAKSTLQDIGVKEVKLKAVHNLISTMVDMLSAGTAGSDLQALMDVDTGNTLLIDMTEAEIFSDRKELSFEDKQIAGSFIGEMFSLLESDKEFSKDLMVEARRTIEEKIEQLHAKGDDLPPSIMNIIATYTE